MYSVYKTWNIDEAMSGESVNKRGLGPPPLYIRVGACMQNILQRLRYNKPFPTARPGTRGLDVETVTSACLQFIYSDTVFIGRCWRYGLVYIQHTPREGGTRGRPAHQHTTTANQFKFESMNWREGGRDPGRPTGLGRVEPGLG